MSVTLNRTYDSNDDGVVFEGSGISVRISHDVLDGFKLPDRGDESGISFGDEPVDVQILELSRHIEVARDPVHETQGKVKW